MSVRIKHMMGHGVEGWTCESSPRSPGVPGRREAGRESCDAHAARSHMWSCARFPSGKEITTKVRGT